VAGNYLLAARAVKSSLRPPQEFFAEDCAAAARANRLAGRKRIVIGVWRSGTIDKNRVGGQERPKVANPRLSGNACGRALEHSDACKAWNSPDGPQDQ
jgi:hypothetical protein